MSFTRWAEGLGPKNASPADRTDVAAVTSPSFLAFTGQQLVGDDSHRPHVGRGTRREWDLFSRRAHDFWRRELQTAGPKALLSRPARRFEVGQFPFHLGGEPDDLLRRHISVDNPPAMEFLDGLENLNHSTAHTRRQEWRAKDVV